MLGEIPKEDKIDIVNSPKKIVQKHTFRMNSTSQQLYHEIEGMNYLDRDEKDALINKYLQSLDDYWHEETSKAQNALNCHHINYLVENPQEAVSYTPMMILNKRFQSNKKDHLRGIIAKHNKKNLEEKHVSNIYKNNQRWIDYANEREAAIEEYVKENDGKVPEKVIVFRDGVSRFALKD